MRGGKRKRIHRCRRAGCEGLALNRGSYCSRRCSMIVIRQNQTPERRREISIAARAKREADYHERMVARVMVLADTLEQRIILAYRFGRMADKTKRYRERLKARRAA